ncbi:hypothetical protein NKH55_23245 [Mesorhizobium opportunistum]|uniref:hypothetical protein n=1 Tax=Mesorhizobium opportunistum TaxID=593909 RepID=UPI003337B234
MMNGQEKSDSGIVAVKPTNKAGQPAAELVEPRPGTKGSAEQQRMHRTQSRARMSQSLDRVRKPARLRNKERFTALFHNINVDTLRTAFYALRRKDRETVACGPALVEEEEVVVTDQVELTAEVEQLGPLF